MVNEPDPVAALLALEAERCRAIATGDLEVLAALLASDYRHVHADGRTDTREQMLVHLAASPPRTTERGPLVIDVSEDGRCAEMTGPCVTTIQPRPTGRGGRVIRGAARQTWVRGDRDRWLLESFAFEQVDAIEDFVTASRA